jgi:hypothetical protein
VHQHVSFRTKPFDIARLKKGGKEPPNPVKLNGMRGDQAINIKTQRLRLLHVNFGLAKCIPDIHSGTQGKTLKIRILPKAQQAAVAPTRRHPDQPRATTIEQGAASAPR